MLRHDADLSAQAGVRYIGDADAVDQNPTL
jgi:hypothetical protein